MADLPQHESCSQADACLLVTKRFLDNGDCTHSTGIAESLDGADSDFGVSVFQCLGEHSQRKASADESQSLNNCDSHFYCLVRQTFTQNQDGPASTNTPQAFCRLDANLRGFVEQHCLQSKDAGARGLLCHGRCHCQGQQASDKGPSAPTS